MTNRRILIGIPQFGHNDPRVTVTLFMLAKYPGTELMQVRRSMPDIARNALAEHALKMKHEFVFFLDDDMTIEEGHPAALLDQLVQAMDKDPLLGIVAPRAYKRTTPFYPCVFRKQGEKLYKPVDTVAKGLVEVDAIHCAATLIRPSVFEKVPKPWFEFTQLGDVRLGEDISFTRKVKEAGIRMMCNTDLQVQHISDPVLVDHSAYQAYNFAKQEADKAASPLVRP